jgi:hypothetical protein
MQLCPGLLGSGMLARNVTKDNALQNVSAALIMPAVDSSQFSSRIKPWNPIELLRLQLHQARPARLSPSLLR